MSKTNKSELFWNIRAQKYNRLNWAKDKTYLESIIKAGNFKKNDVVLDVGTGTDFVAKAIKPYVKKVIGLDLSNAMLKQGLWNQDFSIIQWDIRERKGCLIIIYLIKSLLVWFFIMS